MTVQTPEKQKSLLLEIGGVGFASMYSFQEARIAANNRLRNIVFRKVTGLDYRELQQKKKDRTITKEEKATVKSFDDQKIEDLVDTMLVAGDVTKEEAKYILRLQELAREAERKENQYESLLSDLTKKEVVWCEFLKYVKGIGPRMAGALLYFFGYCRGRKHVSALYAYSGLTPSSKKEKGKKCGFNPKCRMFLIGRIGTQFLMQGNTRYKPIYAQEKERQLHRLETEHKYAPKNKGHAHARARRYMVKWFLKDYFAVCLELTGRDPQDPWVIEHGGHSRDDTIPTVWDYIERRGGTLRPRHVKG